MWFVRLLLSLLAVLSFAGPGVCERTAQAAPSGSTKTEKSNTCLFAEGSPAAQHCAGSGVSSGKSLAALPGAPTVPTDTSPIAYQIRRFRDQNAKARLPKKAHAYAFSGSSPPAVA